MTLTELRDALAKATGPSLLLRCDIAKTLLGWREVDHDCHIRYLDPQGEMWWAAEMPSWDASIDAAVTLVPEGWRLRNVEQADPSLRHVPARAEFMPLDNNDDGWAIHQNCGGVIGRHPSSLAIAICVARIKYEIASR